MFCNAKKHVTVPQEFHFATNERIPPPPPPSAIHDLFDKVVKMNFLHHSESVKRSPLRSVSNLLLPFQLSLNSEPQQNPIPRNTMPNPFHLHTEVWISSFVQKKFGIQESGHNIFIKSLFTSGFSGKRG